MVNVMFSKSKKIIFTCIACILFTTNALAEDTTFNEQLCGLTLNFESEPARKQQIINMNAQVSMTITNSISIKKSLAAQIATNTTCQQLTGASYTGSQQEWSKFFDSAFSGLVKANYQDLKFTLVGENEKAYTLKNSLMTKEYILTGKIKNNKQIIKNLALLDKENSRMYTFSVSGNEMVAAEIDKEFKRLVSSIKSVN